MELTNYARLHMSVSSLTGTSPRLHIFLLIMATITVDHELHRTACLNIQHRQIAMFRCGLILERGSRRSPVPASFFAELRI